MSIKSVIIDPKSKLQATVSNGTDYPNALHVTSRDYVIKTGVLLPFLNDSFGVAMNQSISFGGTPELITDGTDAVGWTGSATVGTWDFASTTNPNNGTKCVAAVNMNNNDEALFSDATTTDMSNYTTITGALRLETYNSGNHNIILQFRLAGGDLGNSINLNDYVDTGILNAYQNFVIPKADFGVSTLTVDELTVIVQRAGGSKPTFRLDDVQIEETGASEVFTMAPPIGTIFHMKAVEFEMADALAATVASGTMKGLSYDKILGVTALSNGVVFQRVNDGVIKFSANLKQLSDFITGGTDIVTAISDGTNTFIKLRIEFEETIILDSRSDDTVTLTISDDLSGLLLFTAFARGGEEIIQNN